VPQGSVLGPLLFDIFLNDLFYFVAETSILYNYADDNTLSKSNTDVKVLEEELSVDGCKAIKWFTDNYMKASAPKCQVAFFSRDNTIEGITITLDDLELHSQSR
jgi:hypothetical protein